MATGIFGASAYLAMEYVAAESLDLAVREYGPAPPADTLRVAAQLAGALDFAAAVNFSHGAIHPRDVLLSSDDTRLTGLGIARALQAVGVNPPMRRPYTAPERVAGESWDRRADVFTLAALAHELLWGRRIVGAGHGIDGMPELPAADQPALRDVFARALAVSPGDRFATALEFAEALKSAFPNVAAAPLATPQRRLAWSEVEGPALSGVEGVGTGSDVEAPRLPLEQAERGREAIAAASATPVAVDVNDLNLQAAEEGRYRHVETAPAVPETPTLAAANEVRHNDVRVNEVRLKADATADPLPERTRSRVPMTLAAVAAALAVGLAVGYGVGMRRQLPVASETTAPTSASKPTGSSGSTAPQVSASGSDAPGAREATEVAVAQPVRPPAASAVPPADVPPAKADNAPAMRRSSTDRPQDVESGRRGPAAASGRVADRRTSASRTAPVRPADRTSDRRAVGPATSASGTVGRFVGHLSVDSRPGGAQVFLDGRPVGTTPLELPTVSAGEHAIRLERDGYRRWSSSIRVVASEKTRVTGSLER